MKPRVIFAEEKGKEVVKPKENMVTQFKPQSMPVVHKGIPAPRAWESHPNAWNGAIGVAPPLQGGWTTAPSTWSAAADATAHDGTGTTSSWQAGPPNPQSNPIGFRAPPPMAIVIQYRPRQGFRKGNVIYKHLQGKGDDVWQRTVIG